MDERAVEMPRVIAQTQPELMTGTVAFRVSAYERHMISAVASRQGLTPSRWLRMLVKAELREILDPSNEVADDFKSRQHP